MRADCGDPIADRDGLRQLTTQYCRVRIAPGSHANRVSVPERLGGGVRLLSEFERLVEGTLLRETEGEPGLCRRPGGWPGPPGRWRSRSPGTRATASRNASIALGKSPSS